MYYASSSRKIPKTKATVSVVMSDGEMFDGHFFLSGHQRVTDLLNGDTQYLPFESLNGHIYVLNKSMISRIVSREAQNDDAPRRR